MSSQYRLAFVIPTIIGVAGIGTAFVSVSADRARSEHEAVTQAAETLEFLSEMVAGEVESAFRQGAPGRSRASLIRVSADPDVRHAVLADRAGTITYSLERRLEGEPLENSPFASVVPVLDSVMASYELRSVLSPDGMSLIVAHPVVARSAGPGSAVGNINVIALMKDLRPLQARAAVASRGRAMIVGLPLVGLSAVIALFFHLAFTRRMRLVLNQTQDAAEGRLERIHPLPGRDEIADLSRALSRMAQEILSRAETQVLMVSELDHRVKNTLATVLALTSQTAASTRTKPELVSVLSGRIRSMAKAHEALAATGWDAVDLKQLVDFTVSATVLPTRFQSRGGRERVPSRAATPLALVMHELSTNAVKHGPLGGDHGMIDVAWFEDASDAEAPRLRLEWNERDVRRDEGAGSEGAEITIVEGLGLTLVRGLVEHEIGGTVAFDAREGRFSCTITLPMHGTKEDRFGY